MVNIKINCLLNAKHQDPIQEFYTNRLHNIKEQNRELVHYKLITYGLQRLVNCFEKIVKYSLIRHLHKNFRSPMHIACLTISPLYSNHGLAKQFEDKGP